MKKTLRCLLGWVILLNFTNLANAKQLQGATYNESFQPSSLRIDLVEYLRDADNLSPVEIKKWFSEKSSTLQQDAIRICQYVYNQTLSDFRFYEKIETVRRGTPICEWRGGCVRGKQLKATASFKCE